MATEQGGCWGSPRGDWPELPRRLQDHSAAQQ